MKSTSWLEFNLSERGEGALIGYNAANPLWILTTSNVEELITKLNEVKDTAKTWKVAPASKPIPRLENSGRDRVATPAISVPTSKKIKKILIDPGHSESVRGASGKSSAVQEDVLNRFQAQCLKKYVEALGFRCDIYDTQEDDLYDIGSRAKDYDLFISLHLNACDGNEHYTCAMVHKKYAKIASTAFASKWAKAMAAACGYKIFSGTEGYPVGVMAASLGVLNAAENSGCPIAMLSELEFMDDETSSEPIKTRIDKAMQAGAKLIAETLK